MVNGVVQRKLALLDNQVEKLKNHFSPLSFEEFKDSWEHRSIAERGLQVAVEICIDIAERIIALKEAGPVAGAGEAMEKLESLGIINAAEPYRSMVRFRNLIVHEYEQMDPEILYKLVTRNLMDFRKFRDELDKSL